MVGSGGRARKDRKKRRSQGQKEEEGQKRKGGRTVGQLSVYTAFVSLSFFRLWRPYMQRPIV